MLYHGDDEMSTELEVITRSVTTRKSKKVKKLSRAFPSRWCFSRRALWHFFLHQSPTRRQRRIILRSRRINRITKTTADNNSLENQRQGNRSKRCKTDETADVGNSSVSVQRESMAEPDNDSYVLRDIMTDPDDYITEDCCKSADIQPLWRPPKSEEYGLWVPSHVKTDGQGRKRLMCDPLVEIFNIEVDLSGRTKTSGNIHGNITLQCGCIKSVLFDCDKKKALGIQQKGFLPLKGSDAAPLALDCVGIFVNLKIDDDELCEDVAVWDPRFASTDEWLDYRLEGRNGFVNVTLAVLKEAWLAELDVKVIMSTKEASSKIYGDIVVYINNMRYLRYFAFSKGRDDCSIVEPQDSIPLSRSLFSCRRGSSLVVKVDLRDSDTSNSLARGALLFPPEYSGNSMGTVSGPRGTVDVNVNWVTFWNHSKTRQALPSDLFF